MKRFFLKLSLILMILALPMMSHADQASHLEAAEDLLASININQTMTETADQMVQNQIAMNPQMAPYKEIMRGFFLKYMTGDVLIKFLSGVYMEEFTEKELNDLTNFYKTPTGKKAIKKLPTLTLKGAQWGQKQVNDNLAELRSLITEEAKRLEKSKAASTPKE